MWGRFTVVGALALALLVTGLVWAQGERPASPRGKASVELGGEWVEREGRMRYTGGKWVEIDYGRPILRGRQQIFGEGEEYGRAVSGREALWRAGANQTTRLETEAALTFGQTTIEPAAYSLFIDLAESGWSLVVSSQPHMESYDPDAEGATWGAYGHDPEQDIVRVPMRMQTSPGTIEQFTISFQDVTAEGGTIAFAWENTVGLADFSLPAGEPDEPDESDEE